MDNSGTTDDGGRWLSYAELAELRGITRKAAIRLTQRHQWRRQPGNDGATRVFVPSDIARRQTPRDSVPPTPPSDDRERTAFEVALAAVREAKDGEIATLRGVVDGLRTTLARTEDRAARAEERATGAETRVVSLEADLREKDAAVAEQREAAEQAVTARQEAETATAGERQRADALRDRAESAERDLAVAQHDAQTAQQAAAELRQAEDTRKGRGRLRRAWDGWRGR